MYDDRYPSPDFDAPRPRPETPDLSLDAMRAFAATRPEDEPYKYHDNRHCAVGQLLRSQGFPDAWVGGWDVRPMGLNDDPVDIPDDLHDVSVANLILPGRVPRFLNQQRTWGGVVTRIDQILAERRAS